MRSLTLQTIASSGADGLASAGFLAAFALMLGASNFHIGVMAAIPFIMQPVQIVAVIAVERLRIRKLIAAPSYLAAYAAWALVGLIPFLLDVPNPGAVTLLLFFIAIRGVATAFVDTSYTSWLRDMAGSNGIGGFFAHRLRVSTIAASAAGLAAAIYVDWWKGAAPESEVIFGYSYAILLGSIALGFGSVGVMMRIPEQLMTRPEGARSPVIRMLSAPLRDMNYRQLVKFIFAWNFVIYLAEPFFSVYMLTILELPLSLVVGLAVSSQIASVLFMRVWGTFVDRYGSKAALSMCSSLYLLVILGWTFTTMPDKHFLTIPLLIVLHILSGIASAGINVSSMTIRMKLAPQAQATAFLTAVSLTGNFGAGISPLIGGAFVDFFSVRHFKVGIEWVDPTQTVDFPAVFLTGYDFLFAAVFVLGAFTLSILGRIREEGEAPSEVAMDQMMRQIRDNLRSLSFSQGMNYTAQFPITSIRYLPNMPGLDMSASVAAYKMASSTRQAVKAVSDAGAATERIGDRVNDVVASESRELGDDIALHGAEMAFGASEGAARAAADAGEDAGRIIQASVGGILEAVTEAGADPLDAIRGAVQGAIHSASSTRLGAGSAATYAIEGVRRAAARLGIPEREAATHAIQAAVEMAENAAPESRTEIKDAVLKELSKDS